jgi:hypothetical protein
MKVLFLISLLVTINSCCGLHHEIIYTHNKIQIKRIDECGKTTFYYTSKENVGSICAKYSGINDGFSGYLQFESNGRVTLFSGDGYFKLENTDTTLFSFNRINGYENAPEISDSVCWILLNTDEEQKRNRDDKSGIRAVYNIDTNEWW